EHEALDLPRDDPLIVLLLFHLALDDRAVVLDLEPEVQRRELGFDGFQRRHERVRRRVQLRAQRRELVELFSQAAQHDGVPPTIRTMRLGRPHPTLAVPSLTSLFLRRSTVPQRPWALESGPTPGPWPLACE